MPAPNDDWSRLFGKPLKNLAIYRDYQEIGFDYILNPATEELHRVGPDAAAFLDGHNLHLADLENFVGLFHLGLMSLEILPANTSVPVVDVITGQQIGTYTLNRCGHCFRVADE